MAKPRPKLKDIIAARLVYVYLLIFPLGQLLRLNFEIVGKNITLHPIDIVAGLALFYLFVSEVKKPRILNNLYSFLSVGAFSLLFSLTIFSTSEVLVGSLYFLRVFAYTGFFVAAYSFVKTETQKNTLLNSLILVSIVIAVFGWIQYFWTPDLRDLKFLGWDDHYFRLTSTFLDPGFAGILLVLGFLTTSAKYLKDKNRKLIPLMLLLLISVIFTYSRASYLSLFSGLLIIFLFVKRGVKAIAIITIVIFLVIIPFIPRDLTEGAQLERTHSIFSKLDDYEESLKVFRLNPVFGVGFNNICTARTTYSLEDRTGSHSCSGSDSSLLLVLATTGIVGLLVYLYVGIKILKSVGRDVYGLAFLFCSGALFIHSLFLNSLFYPWVMGWMAILLAISIKDYGEK